MSLYNAKCKAIRQTLISEENSEKLTKYLQEQGIENLPYSKLAEYIITNGDCGLDMDLDTPLRDAFIGYVDEHTTATFVEIKRMVDECDKDFLMDSWDDIYDALFKNYDIVDNVVYVVECEWDGRKWEHTSEFNLFSDYETAKIRFSDAKENAEIDLVGISDDVYVDEDCEIHWMGQVDDYDHWVEVKMYKKIVV
jgi:hypothetical protein